MLNKNITVKKKYSSNDFPTVVKGLISWCYIMFDYCLGYWSDKYFVNRKLSLTKILKLMGLDSLITRTWDDNGV